MEQHPSAPQTTAGHAVVWMPPVPSPAVDGRPQTPPPPTHTHTHTHTGKRAAAAPACVTACLALGGVFGKRLPAVFVCEPMPGRSPPRHLCAHKSSVYA